MRYSSSPREVSMRRLWYQAVLRRMLVLFDHVTPAGVADCLAGHTVIKAKDRGWDTLSNGDLLRSAERAGFDVVVTADKNMRYQQNPRRCFVGWAKSRPQPFPPTRASP